MEREKTLGMEIHTASNLLERRMNAMISNGGNDSTPVQGRLLGYISHRLGQGHEIYQKDIEADFDIARSTVTATLKLMEKKGLIRRESVPHDARLKRILLTPLGEQVFAEISTYIQQTEALMRSAMTDREHAELIRLLEVVKSVL